MLNVLFLKGTLAVSIVDTISNISMAPSRFFEYSGPKNSSNTARLLCTKLTALCLEPPAIGAIVDLSALSVNLIRIPVLNISTFSESMCLNRGSNSDILP